MFSPAFPRPGSRPSPSTIAWCVLVGATTLLIANDHLLKATVPSLVTGKLSDFAGLVVAPVVLALALRGARLKPPAAAWVACVVVGAFFSALQLFPSAAAGYDSIIGVPIDGLDALRAGFGPGLRSQTVTDRTDLFALPMILGGFWVARHIRLRPKFAEGAALALAAFACLATSVVRRPVAPHWHFPDRSGWNSLTRVDGGQILVTLGRQSVEGSLEIGVVIYADAADIQTVPEDWSLSFGDVSVPNSCARSHALTSNRGGVNVTAATPESFRACFVVSNDVAETGGRLAIPFAVGGRAAQLRVALSYDEYDQDASSSGQRFQ